MRGLFRAALLLGPTLVSALEPAEHGDIAKPKSPGSPLAVIAIEIPNAVSLPDESTILPFQIEVLPSDQPCGHGNVTINGQDLAQQVPVGADTITIGRGLVQGPGAVVDATWSFECLSVSGHPKLQRLEFMVNAVDGTPVGNLEQLGFTVVFAQAGTAQIFLINTDLSSVPDMVASPDALAPMDGDDDYSRARMEEELADLHWMISQLKELEYLIAEKQAAIDRYTPHNSRERIGDCDSWRCVFKGLRSKISCAARKIYSKVQGHDEGDQGDEGAEGWKPHKKHRWFKNPFHHGKGKHGNHNCGDHKNEKGNHSHPHPRPPHWRRPHHRLPICRFPHHPPPHPPHRRPPHRKPHDDPPHHDKPHDGPHGPPEHHKPSNPNHPGDTDSHPSDQEDRLPRPTQAFFQGDQDQDHRQPRPHDGHRSHAGGHHGKHHGKPRRGPSGFTLALFILKFFAFGIALRFFVDAIRRRFCSPSRRADRRARREERRRRRGFNRARRCQSFRRFLARVTGRPYVEDGEDDHDNEKRTALLADAEDGLSVAMNDEIVQFRNAMAVVEELLAAEEIRAADGHQREGFPPREDSRSMTAREVGRRAGEDEGLPAYEDGDGSEMSSVADGIRYTPGSTDYDGSQSREGSVSDILGPDRKN